MAGPKLLQLQKWDLMQKHCSVPDTVSTVNVQNLYDRNPNNAEIRTIKSLDFRQYSPKLTVQNPNYFCQPRPFYIKTTQASKKKFGIWTFGLNVLFQTEPKWIIRNLNVFGFRTLTVHLFKIYIFSLDSTTLIFVRGCSRLPRTIRQGKKIWLQNLALTSLDLPVPRPLPHPTAKIFLLLPHQPHPWRRQCSPLKHSNRLSVLSAQK